MTAPTFRGVRLSTFEGEADVLAMYQGRIHGCDVSVWQTDFGWLADARLPLARHQIEVKTDAFAPSAESALRALLSQLRRVHSTVGKIVAPVKRGRHV